MQILLNVRRLKMPKPTPIDPFDQQHWNKPLFVVYGSTGFPQMLCCKVRLNDGVATIWGFSIWRRTPGFRTLGIKLKTWVERETDPRFYLSQEEAFDDIRGLFSKVEGQPKPRKGHPLILTDEEWSRLKSLTTLMQEQVRGNENFARAYLSGRTGAAKVVTDHDREQAAQHRKAAREYRSLIKSIKEQDQNG